MIKAQELLHVVVHSGICVGVREVTSEELCVVLVARGCLSAGHKLSLERRLVPWLTKMSVCGVRAGHCSAASTSPSEPSCSTDALSMEPSWQLRVGESLELHLPQSPRCQGAMAKFQGEELSGCLTLWVLP